MPPGYYALMVPQWLRQDPRSLTPLRRGGAGPLRRRPAATQPRTGGHGARRCSTGCCPRRAKAGRRARRLATLLDRTASTASSTSRSAPICATAASAWRRTACRPSTMIEDVSRRGRGRLPRARSTGLSRELGRDGAGRRARWPWCRWRPARAAAGRRAPAWSRRCIRSASSAAGTAPSSRFTWPRAGASGGRAAMPCRTSSPPATSRTRRSQQFLAAQDHYGYAGPLLLSPGRAVGLRLVPTVRDLRFAWEEMPAADARRAGAEGAREPARGPHRLGPGGRRRQRLHRQPARCSACTPSATGTRFPTSSATACWRACCASARSCDT